MFSRFHRLMLPGQTGRSVGGLLQVIDVVKQKGPAYD